MGTSSSALYVSSRDDDEYQIPSIIPIWDNKF